MWDSRLCVYVCSVRFVIDSQTYTEYGNTVNIEAKSIRKAPAPAAAAAPAAKAGGKK